MEVRLSNETMAALRTYAKMLATLGYTVNRLDCIEGKLILNITFKGGLRGSADAQTLILSQRITDPSSTVQLKGLISDMFVEATTLIKT